jgi:hypothetical protein
MPLRLFDYGPHKETPDIIQRTEVDILIAEIKSRQGILSANRNIGTNTYLINDLIESLEQYQQNIRNNVTGIISAYRPPSYENVEENETTEAFLEKLYSMGSRINKHHKKINPIATAGQYGASIFTRLGPTLYCLGASLTNIDDTELCTINDDFLVISKLREQPDLKIQELSHAYQGKVTSSFRVQTKVKGQTREKFVFPAKLPIGQSFAIVLNYQSADPALRQVELNKLEIYVLEDFRIGLIRQLIQEELAKSFKGNNQYWKSLIDVWTAEEQRVREQK